MSIREQRKRKNLTQSELAHSLGITRSTVAMWENESAKPRADKLVAMAKIFGCTIDELIRE